MILFYEILVRQVAWVHSDASEIPHLFATPFGAAMYAWLVIVMFICTVLQTRKGYVRLPTVLAKPSIFLSDTSCSSVVLAGVTGTLVITGRCAASRRSADRAVRRCLLGSELWRRARLAGVTIFIATFAALCASFFTAKRRRAKIEAELDSSDDI